LAKGFKFIWEQPAFRSIMLAQLLSNFGMNAFAFALILDFQKQGEEYWKIGLLQTCIGASLLVGSFIAARLVKGLTVGFLIIGAASVRLAVLVMIAALHNNIAAIWALTIVGYYLSPASNSATQSYLTVVTPHHLQGRVAAADELTTGALTRLFGIKRGRPGLTGLGVAVRG